MASVSYDEIFQNFLGSITDYDIQVNLSPSDSYSLMTEYLHKAIADRYVRHIFSSVSVDDDIQVFTYELALSGDEASDNDFVVTALSKWMVYEWLHKEVRSKINTAQMFAGKEQKFYSQSNHIAELRALQDDAYKEARDFIRDRGYIENSYLGGT